MIMSLCASNYSLQNFEYDKKTFTPLIPVLLFLENYLLPSYPLIHVHFPHPSSKSPSRPCPTPSHHIPIAKSRTESKNTKITRPPMIEIRKKSCLSLSASHDSLQNFKYSKNLSNPLSPTPKSYFLLIQSSLPILSNFSLGLSFYSALLDQMGGVLLGLSCKRSLFYYSFFRTFGFSLMRSFHVHVVRSHC